MLGAVMSARTPILKVEDLKIHFRIGQASFPGFSKALTLKAVDGVTFDVHRGETFGIVGESGCGKSTLGQGVLRLAKVTGGSVAFDGGDVTRFDSGQLRAFRRRAQMVYQDTAGALNPRMKVLDIVGEPIKVHRLHSSSRDYRDKVVEVMELVGLGADMANRYPHEFSGGQRQRINIARALAVRPDLIVCDEPVSALDVSLQAQIVNLLIDLQTKLGVTYLFVAHDLALVRQASHRLMVMYLGRVVEIATSEQIYTGALHPYTQALLAAIPIPDPSPDVQRQFRQLQGELPSPIDPPVGCAFHTRCPHVMPICREIRPVLTASNPSHSVACHLHAGGSASPPPHRVA